MKKVIFIILFLLMIACMAVFGPIGSDATVSSEAQMPGRSSFFGFSLDDDGGAGGSGASLPSHYFTNTFLDYTFIIRLKNYKAMEDDNLSEY